MLFLIIIVPFVAIVAFGCFQCHGCLRSCLLKLLRGFLFVVIFLVAKVALVTQFAQDACAPPPPNACGTCTFTCMGQQLDLAMVYAPGGAVLWK